MRTIDPSPTDDQEITPARRLAYWEQFAALDVLHHPWWQCDDDRWGRLYVLWDEHRTRALATRTQGEIKAIHRELLAALEELK